MAPCNGTTSTPSKLVVTLPPNHSALQWHAMALHPLHPASHVQSAKVVRRPPPLLEVRTLLLLLSGEKTRQSNSTIREQPRTIAVCELVTAAWNYTRTRTSSFSWTSTSEKTYLGQQPRQEQSTNTARTFSLEPFARGSQRLLHMPMSPRKRVPRDQGSSAVRLRNVHVQDCTTKNES